LFADMYKIITEMRNAALETLVVEASCFLFILYTGIDDVNNRVLLIILLTDILGARCISAAGVCMFDIHAIYINEKPGEKPTLCVEVLYIDL